MNGQFLFEQACEASDLEAYVKSLKDFSLADLHWYCRETLSGVKALVYVVCEKELAERKAKEVRELKKQKQNH